MEIAVTKWTCSVEFVLRNYISVAAICNLITSISVDLSFFIFHRCGTPINYKSGASRV